MASAATLRNVRLERVEGERVARVVLAAGKGNVITGALADELCSALATAARDHSLCALLLDHEGKDFSFGASVATSSSATAQPITLPLPAASTRRAMRWPSMRSKRTFFIAGAAPR